MNTRQMEQFLEVYKCASFNKASQNLFMSRTALQSSMDSLEKELGQSLFVRSANGISLTDYGQKFLGVSRQVLALCDGLTDAPTQVSENLTVSCSHLQFVAEIFLKQFSALQDCNQDFRYVETTRKQICQDVMDGSSDLGIIALPSYYRNIKERYLKENGLEHSLICSLSNCCLVGPRSPLYYKEDDRVSLQELASYYRAMYDEPQLTDVTDVNLQPPASPSPSPYPCLGKLHINDSGSCHRILRETDCYHISLQLDPKANDLNTDPNIRCLEITDYSLSYDIIWIKRNDRVLSAAMKRFLRSIYEAVDKTPPDALL